MNTPLSFHYTIFTLLDQSIFQNFIPYHCNFLKFGQMLKLINIYNTGYHHLDCRLSNSSFCDEASLAGSSTNYVWSAFLVERMFLNQNDVLNVLFYASCLQYLLCNVCLLFLTEINKTHWWKNNMTVVDWYNERNKNHFKKCFSLGTPTLILVCSISHCYVYSFF